jgi:superfamily II DNA or RNA helicase
MSLTLHGYRLPKTHRDVPQLRKALTVKPYVPSVFVPKHCVPK